MSLETPEKIRTLQRKLYRKAKAEPAFRFYVLYDKVCREDILLYAFTLARANAGAPGVDGMTFRQIEALGVEAWLTGLREDLVSKTYRPDPVRRVSIPETGGGERSLRVSVSRARGGRPPRSGVGGNVPSVSRRSGTGWFKPPPRSCWSRSSRRTLRTALMAIDRVVARSMLSRKRTG